MLKVVSHPERLFILSDLHIWGPDDPLCSMLIDFLKSKLVSGDSFFLVGDLFDVFLGTKKNFIDRYQDLLNAFIETSEKGVQIYYIEGNHDFCMEEAFKGHRNIKILKEDYELLWKGKKIYFAHGDQINKKDRKYHAWRSFTRSSVFSLITKILPGTFIEATGRSLSKMSRSYNPQASDETIRMFRNFACEKISQGYHIVILGHSHYCDDFRFRVGDHIGQYANVGFPRVHQKYLQAESNDAFLNFIDWT